MNTKVQQYILKLSDSNRQIVLRVRDLFLSGAPSIEEDIKWNQLTFSCGSKNIAFIYTYGEMEYMNLGFFDAISLSDPNNLFQGTGKKMRHIKIYSPRDIPVKQISKWISEAITLCDLQLGSKSLSPRKKV